MKKITFFLLLLAWVTTGYSQIQFGTGNNTTQNAPFSPTFWYSYAQSIYLATDINASGEITSIKWHFNGETSLQYSQDLVIYLGHTQKTVFDSETDWILPDEMTVVYNGGISPNGNDWVTIQLDVPFLYNGVDNLIVSVAENTAGRDANSDKFSNTLVNGMRTLAAINSDSPINVNNPPTGPWSSYVPNIIFGGISQLCKVPMYVKTNGVFPTTANIVWDQPQEEPSGGSEYFVSQEYITPDSNTEPSGSIASGNTVEITSDIFPNTAYYVWIRNICAENTVSGWSYPAKFITPCSGVTEFNENFDGVEAPALPSCWTKVVKGEGITAGTTVGTGSVFVHSAPNSVNFFSYEIVEKFMLVSPNLSNLSAGTHRLKFYASQNYGPGMIEIGTLNNDGNSETASFTLYESIDLIEGINQYIVDFSSYNGTDTFIAIKIPEFNALNISLDNFVWETLPSCPDVSEIKVTSIKSNSATVNWLNGGIEDSWQVAAGLNSIINPNDLTAIGSSQITKEITDLLPETYYTVWVRSVCQENDFGSWIGPVTFKTDCAAIQSFNENFNEIEIPKLPLCWSKIIKGETLSPYASIHSNYNEMSSAPYAIEFSDDSSVTGDGNDLILISPKLSTLSVGTYRLKFNARKSGSNAVTFQIGTLTSNDDQTQFTMFEEIALSGNSTQYIVNFAAYTGSDEYLGIRMNSNSSYNNVFVDDIVWEIAPTCFSVSNITVQATTSNSVNVSWNPGGNESDWDVVIGANNITNPNMLTVQAFNNPTALLGSLSAATNYKIWVRSSCDNGNDKGEWIGPISFMTRCNPITEFNETFDEVIAPNLPVCWTELLRGDSISDNAYVTTYGYDTVFSQPNSVVLHNDSSNNFNDIMLISPELSTLTTGTHRLKFYARSQNHPQGVALEIGTLDSNLPNAVFNSYGFINLTDEVKQYIIDFDSYSGTDTFIGIRMDTDLQFTHVAIDNVVWEAIPSCPDVTDVEVNEITAATATINWGEDGEELAWDIVWGLSNVTDPNVTVNSTASTIAETTISGLTANTGYNLWVRSSCAGGDKGTWMGPIAFTTPCEPTNVPYIENFETSEDYSLPVCTSVMNAGNGNQWFVYDNPGYEFDTKTLMYGSNFISNADAWFFTQGINLTANTSYTISYNYGTEYYGLESLKVMYGNSRDASGMTNLIADYPNFTSPQSNQATVTFTPSATDVYYFGFNAYSVSNQYSIFIDNIKIDTVLSIQDPEWEGFSYYPNPTTDLLNLSYTENIATVTVYNLLGQEMLTQIVNANHAKVNLTGLSTGTYMMKVSSDKASKTLKIVKK